MASYGRAVSRTTASQPVTSLQPALATLLWLSFAAASAQAAPPARATSPVVVAAPHEPSAHKADGHDPDAHDPDLHHGDGHEHGPARAIGFAEAVGAVAERDDIRRARAAVGIGASAARALGASAGSWQIQALPSVRFAPSGDQGPELQGGLQRTIPLADLAGARRAALAAEGKSLLARVELDALAARLTVAQAWIELQSAERVAALLQAEAATAVAAIAQANQGRSLGAGAALAQAEADVWQAEIEVRRREIEHIRHHAMLVLGQGCGLDDAPALRAQGDLPTPPLPADRELDAAPSRAANSAEVRLASLERTAAKLRAEESIAARGSWLQVGGWFELAAPNSGTARLTLGWNLPSPTQSGRAAAEEARSLAMADVEIARRRREAATTLRDAIHELRHSRQNLEALRAHLLPAAQKRLALRQRALQLGEGRRSEVFDAQRQTLQVEIDVVRAEAAASWAAVRLWLLLGQLGPESSP